MSAGRWFRMYNSVLDDPKVQQLSDFLFRGWINLMCLASRDDGIIPKNLSSIAFSLRISEQKAKTLVDGLRAATLLDDVETGFEPHNWNGRQYKSDVSTERVKRFRERSKLVSVTAPDTESDTEQNRTDNRARFEDFFSVYPKQEKRTRAEDAFAEASSLVPAELIIAGAERYARKIAKEKTEARFIAFAHNWLSEKRWTEGANGNGHMASFNSPEEIEGQRLAKERAERG